MKDSDVKTLYRAGLADKTVMSERKTTSSSDDDDGKVRIETAAERSKRIKEEAAKVVSNTLVREKSNDS